MMSAVLAANVGFPMLPVLVLLPAVGALAVAITPSTRGDLSRAIALMTTIMTAALGVYLMVEFETSTTLRRLCSAAIAAPPPSKAAHRC